MRYDRASKIKFFTTEIKEDRLSFSDIRKQLEAEKIDEEEIKIVYRAVDDNVQKAAQSKANKEIGRSVLIGGLVLFTLGLVVTIGTYSGFFDLGGGYLIMYGPISAGVMIAAKGFHQMQQ